MHTTPTTRALRPNGRFLADHIPGTRYVDLNAAHLSNVENADRFAQQVSGCLNS